MKSMRFMASKLITTLLFAISLALLVGCGGSSSSDQTLTLETVCGREPSRDLTMKIVGGRECGSTNGTVVKLLLFDEEDNQTICT